MGDRPRDPGGTVPPGAQNDKATPTAIDILVSALESSMDTDASTTNVSETKLKRKLLPRVCTHCNKRKRKHGSENKQTDCNCSSNSHTQVGLGSSPVNSNNTNTTVLQYSLQ